LLSFRLEKDTLTDARGLLHRPPSQQGYLVIAGAAPLRQVLAEVDGRCLTAHGSAGGSMLVPVDTRKHTTKWRLEVLSP